ncbi:MAG: membrane or secreted protein [Chitinophagaceae bacterium]
MLLRIRIVKTGFGIVSFLFLALLCNRLHAQPGKQNKVYVDKQGVLRWTTDKKEAAFFGVNYTVPFAYGYRSHKALGKDLKQAIDEDVYHFARLGLDAFRVHIWDTEITDSLGNLLTNEHLDLFDYLLYRLQQHHIYVLITPIAFWGNGYPERDERTPGFSRVYGKGPAVVKEEAIQAQENYLRQLMTHVNPYTKTSYRDDANIIATEINNEPHHSGPKEKTTEYVNRLAAAVRGTGWTKPVFYNISESPRYAGAIAAANVDGHSFQWYPSGLVAGYEQKGNFLPHVDRYTIPFDTVPAYRNKARMVYEFDAADILQSYLYPAMARSYRTAGFQWCTQFAWDPLATAYGNTEYQTHYLSLAYTPSKAISLLIASKVFHRVPRLKEYGSFPADTVFDVFRVSYRQSLSEMNSEEEFYYSNSTTTQPKDLSRLQHIAGVGNSSVVQYEGTGAYFLDKIREGVWRLEVMPDAIQVRDPFEKASPKKEVTRIQWQSNRMDLPLPDLGAGFEIRAKNGGNKAAVVSSDGSAFMVMPGVYLLTAKGAGLDPEGLSNTVFVAPQPYAKDVALSHTPLAEVSAGKPFTVSAIIAGLDTADNVSLELRAIPRWRTIPMQRKRAGEYVAEVPADVIAPGVLNYRIIIRKGSDHYVFPGGGKSDPYAWDNTNNETWQTLVASEASGLELFNTNTDRSKLVQYNTDWRNNVFRFVPSAVSSQLAVKMIAPKLADQQVIAWQYYFGDKLKGRSTELSAFTRLVVRARTESAAATKIVLVTKDGGAFSAALTPGEGWTDIAIPLNRLQPDSFLLLPRPYPGFLPLWFSAGGAGGFQLADAEKLQVIAGEGKPVDLEIASVWLEK